MNASVEGKTNGKGVDWDILGTVVLHDLENEGNKQEGHEEFDQECLHHKFSVIVATVGWAQLCKVVTSLSWELVVLLWAEWEAHEADGASEHASEDLREHDEDTVENTWTARLVSMLNHHRDCYCWVEVPATYRPKDLGHDENDKSGNLRRSRGATAPVDACCQHGRAEELRNEHPHLVFFTAWYFH